jgi:ABC-type lipoprotein release transport system permease subunit
VSGFAGSSQRLDEGLNRLPEPITLAAVPALLTVVGFFACLIPSRRAMRLSPVDVLRAE